jgi:hypothetical protein
MKRIIIILLIIFAVGITYLYRQKCDQNQKLKSELKKKREELEELQKEMEVWREIAIRWAVRGSISSNSRLKDIPGIIHFLSVKLQNEYVENGGCNPWGIKDFENFFTKYPLAFYLTSSRR